MEPQRFLIAACWVVLLFSAGHAQHAGKDRIELRDKLQSRPAANTLININNISMRVRSDGLLASDMNDEWGAYFPRQTAGVVFSEGIVWVGQVDDGVSPRLRANGQVYFAGTVPGGIVSPGVSDGDDRVWRIRRDFATADLILDAAEINNTTPERLTDDQLRAVRDRYRQDWLEWPANKGAPFYDADNDGIYSPRFNDDGSPKLFPEADEPGWLGADQVVWLVANDLDERAALALHGAPPIGLEQQTTLWAYDDGPFADVVFKRYLLIYKGTAATPAGAAIDSMYLTQFVESDVGDWSDDFCGCDSTLDMGFAYNSRTRDDRYAEFDLPPPAIGYVLLQGPLIQTGLPADRGLWNYRERAGAVNLPMTSCWVEQTGDSRQVPTRGTYAGTLEWWNVMRGFNPRPHNPPAPFRDPQGEPVRIEKTGDPVTGSGWVDSAAGERRFSYAAGPFTLALGDSQECVIAIVAGLGADQLGSIVKMRQTAQLAKLSYRNLSLESRLSAGVEVEFAGRNANVQVVADASAMSASQVRAILTKRDETMIAELTLQDNGRQGDGAPDDGVFGGAVLIGAQPEGLFLNLEVTAEDGGRTFWPRLASGITTAGPMQVIEPEIFSDSFNNDGQANPPENVHYGFTLVNSAPFSFQDLRLTARPELSFNRIEINGIPPQSDITLRYDSNDPNTYFSFQVPAGMSEGEFPIFLQIADGRGNVWQDTISFSVTEPPEMFTYAGVEHVTGHADGEFGVRIVTTDQVQNHLYAIRGVDDYDVETPGAQPGFTLIDSTAGRTLLSRHPLPDLYGHNTSIIDGFKIFRGSLTGDGGKARSWSFEPREDRWFTGGDHAGELFFGGVFLAPSFTGSLLENADYRDVEIRFVAKTSFTDLNGNGRYDIGEPYELPEQGTQNAWFYESWGRGNYIGFKPVPFTVWDVLADPPRQLSVAIRDRDRNGQWDLHKQYLPGDPDFVDINNGDLTSNYLIILDSGHDPSGRLYDPQQGGDDLFADILDGGAPVQWVLWLDPVASREPYGAAGTMELVPEHPVTGRDLFVFNPTMLTTKIDSAESVPGTFALEQNYPNPFSLGMTARASEPNSSVGRANAATTIRFSLAVGGSVRLVVYNLLGQQVKVLSDQLLPAGEHSVRWTGVDELNNPVPAGVYFYKLVAGDQVRIRKLLVLP